MFVYRVGKTETIYLFSVLFINPVVYACVCNSNILQKGEGRVGTFECYMGVVESRVCRYKSSYS